MQASAAPLWARIIGWLGLAAHAVVLFFYVTSGLVAPGWAVLALVAAWAGLLVLAIRLLRTRPAVVLLVPVFAIVLWFAVLSAGEAFLGWTA